jgi:hypothetical protein
MFYCVVLCICFCKRCRKSWFHASKRSRCSCFCFTFRTLCTARSSLSLSLPLPHTHTLSLPPPPQHTYTLSLTLIHTLSHFRSPPPTLSFHPYHLSQSLPLPPPILVSLLLFTPECACSDSHLSDRSLCIMSSLFNIQDNKLKGESTHHPHSHP